MDTAAREYAAAVHIAAEHALIAQTLPQVERAEADVEPLAEALAEAQAAVDEQKAHVGQLRGVVSMAAQRRKHFDKMIEWIEAERPRNLMQKTRQPGCERGKRANLKKGVYGGGRSVQCE